MKEWLNKWILSSESSSWVGGVVVVAERRAAAEATGLLVVVVVDNSEDGCWTGKWTGRKVDLSRWVAPTQAAETLVMISKPQMDCWKKYVILF